MDNVHALALGFGAALIFVLARKLGPRLQFWKAPGAAHTPGLDAQIRKKELERFDPLFVGALAGMVLLVSIDTAQPSFGKLLLLPIIALFVAGFFLQQSTTPQRNVLARRYTVARQLILLSLTLSLSGIAYLAIEPFLTSQ